MIEVKIARNLLRDGVEGVRWVLVDPLDALPGSRSAASPSTGLAGLVGTPAFGAQAAAAGGDGAAGAAQGVDPAMASRWAATGAPIDERAGAPRQVLMLSALKTVVVVLALGAALATAWRVIGPPRWGGNGAASGVRPAVPANPAASAPTVTAWRAGVEGRR